VALGGPHRGVGLQHKVLDALGVDAERRPTRGGGHVVSVHHARLADGVHEPVGELRGLPGPCLHRDDRKLVAAVTADDVLAAQHTREPAGDALEQLVAGAVSEIVVDRLEAIEVEQYD
jgi:hypothetical protein